MFTYKEALAEQQRIIKFRENHYYAKKANNSVRKNNNQSIDKHFPKVYSPY